MQDTKFGFQAIRENVRAMKEDLPVILANQAQNFFVASFTNQGWDGVPWQIPQRKIEGTPEYKYPKLRGLGRRTLATLVQSGALRQATNTAIRSQRFGVRGIVLIVDLPYAQAHNDGEGHMPKRTFMKHSPVLGVMQVRKIKEFTNKVWRVN